MEIIKFVSVNKGTFVCEIDLKIPKWGSFIIRKIKVFEKEGGRWIVLPSQEYEKDGKKQFYAYNLFEERKTFDLFQEQVFKAFDEYIEKNQKESHAKAL